MKFLGWVYVHIILYYAGAALTDEELEEMKGTGDRWTFWLRRSKKRLGWVWWAGLAGGTGFISWLLLHIIGVF